MPRVRCHVSDVDAIEWHPDRLPDIGAHVVLCARGVYRVLRVRPTGADGVAAEYDVERVRETTPADA